MRGDFELSNNSYPYKAQAIAARPGHFNLFHVPTQTVVHPAELSEAEANTFARQCNAAKGQAPQDVQDGIKHAIDIHVAQQHSTSAKALGKLTAA